MASLQEQHGIAANQMIPTSVSMWVAGSRHLDAEHLTNMFVDDVADADCRSDLDEVGREAVVETGRTLVLQDRTKESRHRSL